MHLLLLHWLGFRSKCAGETIGNRKAHKEYENGEKWKKHNNKYGNAWKIPTKANNTMKYMPD